MNVIEFSKTCSASSPDWSREQIRSYWDPGRKLIRAIRRYQAARQRGGGLGWLAGRYWKLVHFFWSNVTQCEIHLTSDIGGGLMLPHPTGIIIHPSARIGPNCLIFHQVTLAGAVVLGGHVDIGAGAKLLGPLTVADHVQIGANAVVTKDLPTLSVAVGVPAVIRIDGRAIVSDESITPTVETSGAALPL